MGELKDIITGRQSSKKYRKDNLVMQEQKAEI